MPVVVLVNELGFAPVDWGHTVTARSPKTLVLLYEVNSEDWNSNCKNVQLNQKFLKKLHMKTFFSLKESDTVSADDVIELRLWWISSYETIKPLHICQELKTTGGVGPSELLGPTATSDKADWGCQQTQHAYKSLNISTWAGPSLRCSCLLPPVTSVSVCNPPFSTRVVTARHAVPPFIRFNNYIDLNRFEKLSSDIK